MGVSIVSPDSVVRPTPLGSELARLQLMSQKYHNSADLDHGTQISIKVDMMEEPQEFVSEFSLLRWMCGLASPPVPNSGQLICIRGAPALKGFDIPRLGQALAITLSRSTRALDLRT